MKKLLLVSTLMLASLTANASLSEVTLPSGEAPSALYQWGKVTDFHPSGVTIVDYANEFNLHYGALLFTVDPNAIWEDEGPADENFSTNFTDIVNNVEGIHIHTYAGGDPANPIHTFPGVDLVPEVSAVPLPAAVWLFGAGLIGLVGIARRKA